MPWKWPDLLLWAHATPAQPIAGGSSIRQVHHDNEVRPRELLLTLAGWGERNEPRRTRNIKVYPQPQALPDLAMAHFARFALGLAFQTAWWPVHQ